MKNYCKNCISKAICLSIIKDYYKQNANKYMSDTVLLLGIYTFELSDRCSIIKNQVEEIINSEHDLLDRNLLITNHLRKVLLDKEPMVVFPSDVSDDAKILYQDYINDTVS